MPRNAKTSAIPASWADDAMKAFGMNRVRAEIIRYLATESAGATSGQIARDLEATYQTIFRHLQDLEGQGIVESDGTSNRHGQRVIYRLDKQERDRALSNYAKYLDGK
ncbi:hypothetical protein GCM10025778_15280 [Paeniglutamicibacter antarcticus]|uniref:HTH arsR-type domain-containing protein n=2 Tax=Paeniglutamicibacter antarcticus TaxID=494023 RepID=A0ABP9TLE0_9MICC